MNTLNAGLSGAYNSSVIRAAEGEIKEDALRGVGYSLVLVGRKAESYYKFRGYDIDAVFSGFTETPTYEDARRIGRFGVGWIEHDTEVHAVANPVKGLIEMHGNALSE